MKIMSKGQEYTVLYDDEDHELVSKYHWCITQAGYVSGYIPKSVLRTPKNYKILMHRMIMDVLQDRRWEIDHINHNTIDNRKLNLRKCTHAQNISNQIVKRGELRCICFDKARNKWMVQIMQHKKHVYRKRFTSLQDAILQRDIMLVKYYGEFANLNFK